VVASEGQFALVRSREAGQPHGDPITVTTEQLRSEYTRVGDSDYYVNTHGEAFRMRERPDGTRELLNDPDVVVAQRAQDGQVPSQEAPASGLRAQGDRTAIPPSQPHEPAAGRADTHVREPAGAPPDTPGQPPAPPGGRPSDGSPTRPGSPPHEHVTVPGSSP